MSSYAERMGNEKGATSTITKSKMIDENHQSTKSAPKSSSASASTSSPFDLTSDEPIVAKQRIVGQGFVKNVLSGDSIIVGKANGPEKRIFITGIAAPKLGMGKAGVDEAFAWQSREFLRSKLFGKKVTFVSHGESFADVLLDGEDVATMIVANGYATVTLPKAAKDAIEAAKKDKSAAKKSSDSTDTEIRFGSPEKEALYLLQVEAEKKKLGMFASTSGMRTVNWEPNTAAYYKQFKNKPMPAIVDRALDGSTLRLLVPGLPANDKNGGISQSMLNVSLAGVLSPRVPMKDAKDKKAETAVPFAIEAQEFVETRLKNRDVAFIIQALDKNGTLYGTVVHPKGNIAIRLVEAGLARLVPWTKTLLSSDDQSALNVAAEKASMERIGLYANDSVAKTSSPAFEYEGTVTQVLSGDTFVVRGPDGVENKVSLASVQAPRGRLANSSMEPFAFEAKEFLRKSLIQKKVQIVVEYSRTLTLKKRDDKNKKNSNKKNATKDDEETTEQADEEVESPQADEATEATETTEVRHQVTAFKGKFNVAVELLQAGLADVMTYNSKDAERSMYYAELCAAEAAAKAAEKGKHNTKTVPNTVMDLTSNGKPGSQTSARVAKVNAERVALAAKTLQSATRAQAVIDQVFSATRVKLYVPAVHAYVGLTLSGIYGPPASAKGEPRTPVANACLKFLRSLSQQDVEIEVMGVSKSGDSFIGNVFILPQRESLCVALLRQGFASTISFALDRNSMKKQMIDAETTAKGKRIGIWVDFDEAKERAERERARAEAIESVGFAGVFEKDGAQYVTITITDVADGVNFYFNNVADTNVALVAKVLAAQDFSVAAPADFEPKKGDLVVAKFSDDGLWYRARINSFNKSSDDFTVQFIDYGNVSNVSTSMIRPCPKELISIKQLARPACLSALQHPAVSSEYFETAGNVLAAMTSNQEFEARIDAHERRKGSNDLFHLTLTHADEAQSVNAVLLQEGWARVVSRPLRSLDHLVPELEAYEESAKAQHLNIWEYGSCASDNEDSAF